MVSFLVILLGDCSITILGYTLYLNCSLIDQILYLMQTHSPRVQVVRRSSTSLPHSLLLFRIPFSLGQVVLVNAPNLMLHNVPSACSQRSHVRLAKTGLKLNCSSSGCICLSLKPCTSSHAICIFLAEVFNGRSDQYP